MNDVAFALKIARGVGHRPHLKLHTGPIRSHVAGRTDHLPNHVPSGSYVLPADIVSALGEGNTDAGFKIVKNMLGHLRRIYGGIPYAGGGLPYGGNDGPYGQRVGHARGGHAHHHHHHSEHFHKWFGKSRIVDEKGAPLTVYHGTGGDFNSFKATNEGAGSRESRIGHWFTDNPEAASQFADFAARGRGANVMPVHLRMENPWVASKYDDIRDLIDRHTDFRRPGYIVGGRQIRMTDDKVNYDNARQELLSKGHDGIVLPNSLTDSPDGKTRINQYVVFHPSQIKSALGNQGTFDPNDPDINKATGGSVKQPVPCVLAGGEHVLSPEEVAHAGDGDMEAGHRALDEFVKAYRAKTVKTLKGLPGPRRD